LIAECDNQSVTTIDFHGIDCGSKDFDAGGLARQALREGVDLVLDASLIHEKGRSGHSLYCDAGLALDGIGREKLESPAPALEAPAARRGVVILSCPLRKVTLANRAPLTSY
jgi:hypothetical protein